MTPDEFKTALRRLGRTQIGFALEIGVSRRTVHLWAERGPPAYAVYLLTLIERYGVKAAQNDQATPIPTDPAHVLSGMYTQAISTSDGPSFVGAVEHWVQRHKKGKI
ncbi:helix-turn-helix domain-containing protein [Methylorubrum thiocyanatum]|uniref:Uncharacterized protein n=1 Tax=Methylorubrum thiocyanatum TaxID=47958 RepID=A0AA40S4C9_9HYPH|nr:MULTISPECIES: hypothetical protein [Methylorubrum]MBA8914179.1 hypothetical protein [Methylorubrum thiocyanatum]